jgi:hypothetical protein
VQALERAVELVQRRFMPHLGEGVHHFFLDFLLVEGPDERRLAVAARGLFFGLPPIVKDCDSEFTCH